MSTSELRVRPSPYLAEAREEGLSAGRAAPLLDAVTVLEEDAWALATAACLGQTGCNCFTIVGHPWALNPQGGEAG